VSSGTGPWARFHPYSVFVSLTTRLVTLCVPMHPGCAVIHECADARVTSTPFLVRLSRAELF
jgi:hypothetical protein